MLLLRRRSPLDIERKLALSLSAPSLLILQAEFVLGIAGCLIGIASGRRNCLSGLIGRILRFHPARHSSRSNMMLHSIPSRLALSAVLAAAMLPAVVSAQSQDSQSVAEASRRARAQKKNSEKPSKVTTDDTLDVKKGDVQSATAEQLRIPGTPQASAQAASNAPSTADQNEKKASDDEKRAKEIAALKEQIKQAQSDLDLAKRELALQQDTYYSNVDYARDTAGKAKVDDLKQQVSDKQQELERLKARLAAKGGSDANPPKP